MFITSESRIVMYSWQALYIQAILWAAALIRLDFRKTVFILACPAITPTPSTVALSQLCNLSSPHSAPRTPSAHALFSSSTYPLPHSLLNISSFFHTSPRAPYNYLLPPFHLSSTPSEKSLIHYFPMGLKLFGLVGWPAGRQNRAGNCLIHTETLPSLRVLI